MKHLVIGNLGEVGSAIQKLFDCAGIDKVDEIPGLAEGIELEIMHICIPFKEPELFYETVLKYQYTYKPRFTIIHSTVPVGTSRKLNAIHSPIRGLHPNLYEGIMTFPKFLGGVNAGFVAHEFRRAGLKVILCNSQEATELGKLLDTEYYRACIEFTQRANSLCNMNDVNFHEAYTLFNQTYNEGYEKLGHPEYIRPVLQPIMGEIGGHCVTQNSKLI